MMLIKNTNLSIILNTFVLSALFTISELITQPRLKPNQCNSACRIVDIYRRNHD